MESYIINPPYSFLLSLSLLLGNFSLGHFFLKIKKIKIIFSEISNINFQKILIGQVILIFFIFPLIVLFNNVFNILFFFLIINFVFLIFYILEILLIKKFKQFNFFKKESVYFYGLILLLLLYFFLASSPITDVDSLDYHLGSAVNLLKYNKYILHQEWFTLAQSGAGEVLIALGLFLGAEQYSSLIQFSGLLSICGILLKVSEINKVFKSKYTLVLIVLTCPVLLFLVSTAKPQLFFSACLLIALSLIFRDGWKKNIYLSYAIINVFVFISIIGKFSFNLSGSLILVLSIIRIINFKNIFKLFLISFCFCILIYAPYIYWKWNQYGGSFFLYLISPFPTHLPGYNNFLDHIKAPSRVKFPYFLLFTDSFSTITETLGFSSLIFLYFLFCKKSYEIYLIILISIIYLIVANLYASPGARYFFDVILWLAFAFKYIKKFNNIKILYIFYFAQFFLVAVSLIYSVYNLFPGSITSKKYFALKNNYAYEYSGLRWVQQEMGEKEVLIISRTLSMYGGPKVSGLFLNFTNLEQSLYYKNLIKEKKIKYFATFGLTPRFDYFGGCIKGLYKYKENVGNLAIRNPFTKKYSYNAYIYYLDYEKLPQCNT